MNIEELSQIAQQQPDAFFLGAASGVVVVMILVLLAQYIDWLFPEKQKEEPSVIVLKPRKEAKKPTGVKLASAKVVQLNAKRKRAGRK